MMTTAKGEPYQWILAHLDYDRDDCLIWPYADDGHGYAQFNHKGKQTKVHRFICIEVNGLPPEFNSEAAHSCGNGNKKCVNPKHLRWATPVENQWDRLDHGTHNRGERCGTHKLVREDVLAVVTLLDSGSSHQSIADYFGVHRCTITDIAKGKNWSWLTGRVHHSNPKPPVAANDNAERKAA